MSRIRPALRPLWSEADASARYCIAVTAFLVMAAAAVTGFAPLLLKMVVDKLEQEAALLDLLHLILVYALSYWLSRALSELRSMYFGRADQCVQRRLSYKLFEHIMDLPLRFHLDRATGALGQTLTNGLLGYRMILHHMVITVLPVFVQLGAMCIVLVSLEQATFLAIIGITAVLYTFIFWSGVTRIGPPARAASNAHISAYAFLTDSVLNYETIKYFGAESRVKERFVDAITETEAHWRELLSRKLQNGLAAAVVFALSLGVSVYIAARAVLRHDMSIGEFVLVHTYILQITRPLETIGFALRDVAQGIAFVEKLVGLLREEREAKDSKRRLSLAARPPELSFERVSYSYHPDRRVLKDVSFDVPFGSTVAVVGASGSGKSSLIRLLLRLVEPSAGRIWIGGMPLSKVSVTELRSTIAVVPQDIVLFNESIAYNIAFGSDRCSEAEIICAAKRAHVHEFVAGLPNGYETKVGERGLKLSGGEKQRVAIARALIKKPKIFLFDEVTSSLDPETERAIFANLLEVSGTTTTLIIAHRLSTVVHADDIVMLDKGAVIERGTHVELLARRCAYSAMWHAQYGGLNPQYASAGS